MSFLLVWDGAFVVLKLHLHRTRFARQDCPLDVQMRSEVLLRFESLHRSKKNQNFGEEDALHQPIMDSAI